MKDVKVPKIHPNYYIPPRPGALSDSDMFLWCRVNTPTGHPAGGPANWKFIGWKRETRYPNRGQLGFIIGTKNGEKWHVGVHPTTRMHHWIEQLSPPRQFVPAMKRRPVFLGFFR